MKRVQMVVTLSITALVDVAVDGEHTELKVSHAKFADLPVFLSTGEAELPPKAMDIITKMALHSVSQHFTTFLHGEAEKNGTEVPTDGFAQKGGEA